MALNQAPEELSIEWYYLKKSATVFTALIGAIIILCVPGKISAKPSCNFVKRCFVHGFGNLGTPTPV